MNYSETTFVLADEETDGGYDVRIFAPGGEVPFAGHATLGTSYVIRHEILGKPEDPATGSAAGCLAAYLAEHHYLGTDSVDVQVEQGYEIRRPSLLYLRAEKAGEETSIHVGGKVQMVAKGELITTR